MCLNSLAVSVALDWVFNIMPEWKNDTELFALMRKVLYTPVMGDILDTLGCYHQFLPQPIQPIRESDRLAGRAMPVLILTARDRWSDKVQGFDAGADDYVAKPFHLEEVLARIRALLRRSAGHARSELNCGTVRLDTRTGRVTVDGNPVKLTSHEYRLLSYLMHHTGRVVSRGELVEHLYDQDFDRDSNTIEVFIGRLRKKIPPDMIKTVRGLGYRLTKEGDDA